MTTQRRIINPALLAALEHFASRQYDWNKPTAFCYTDPATHRQSLWPVERTTALAFDALSEESLAFLELRQLKDGMKELGFERLYERITGEKLT